MELEGRLRALAERHADLDRQIAAENAAVHPDEMRVAALKKEKLHMKDEIFAIRRQMDHVDGVARTH